MLKRNGAIYQVPTAKQWLSEHALVFAIETKCFIYVWIENDIISYN